MQAIEIDFEVFKELTMRRKTEAVTYNEVIRELLKLTPSQPPIAKTTDQSWISKGISFPNGTEFRATYKGTAYFAQIQNGGFYHNKQKYQSFSAAACAITGNSVNGWKFWECRLPGIDKWKPVMDYLRK